MLYADRSILSASEVKAKERMPVAEFQSYKEIDPSLLRLGLSRKAGQGQETISDPDPG
jgi:hypothetical protein